MLPCQVAIIVTSTTQGNVPAPALSARWQRTIFLAFCRWFGGATIYPGIGGWMSPEKGLIQEAVYRVESNCDDAALAAHRQDVFDIAGRLCRDMTQEAISVYVNGTLFFEDGQSKQIRVTA